MTTRFLAIVATAIYFACAVVPASAQGLSGVAVVDIQHIMRESAAAKSIQGQIEKLRSSYQQEITKQENELRSAEQELNRQRTLVSPDAFNERRRQFEQRVGNLQKDVQSRKRALDQSFSSAMRTVENSLRGIIEQMVSERKLTLVLIKSQTVYSAPELEMTDEVMKRLNAKLPSVKVPPPKPQQQNPPPKAKSPGK
jgi:Skp family chaperone for outer membrane proteins